MWYMYITALIQPKFREQTIQKVLIKLQVYLSKVNPG